MPARRPSRAASRAFNLLEMLVVMLLIGIFATVTYTSLDRTMPRVKLRGKATEMSGFLQQARLSAIKAGLDVSVEAETFGGDEIWLVAYRANSTGGGKTETARLNIGSVSRPFEAYLAGTSGGSTESDKANTFPAGKLVYKSTGNAVAIGAFRVSIGQLNRRNTIEVAVTSLGGQPVVRKYIRPADRPTSAPTIEFFEETHFGTQWEWSWYSSRASGSGTSRENTMANRTASNRRQSGRAFSLIEMIITSLLVGVIVIGVVPLFTHAVTNNIYGADASQLASFLRSGTERVQQVSANDAVLVQDNNAGGALDPSGTNPGNTATDPDDWIFSDSTATRSVPTYYDSGLRNTLTKSDETLGDEVWRAEGATPAGLFLWRQRREIREFSVADIFRGNISVTARRGRRRCSPRSATPSFSIRL